MTTILYPKNSDEEFNKLILELARLVARHGIEHHVKALPDVANVVSIVSALASLIGANA